MALSSDKGNNSNTAWLTGLRGIAALIVTFTHFIAGELEVGFRDYFADEPEDNRRIFQLPPFRIIFAAQAMVALFFIISAYSISIGTLRKRDYAPRETFLIHLAGSVLRRPIRLFAPVVALEVVSHCAFYFGFYPWTDLINDHLVSFWDIFCHYFRYLLNVMWPRPDAYYFPIGLNIQIWTIPVEFRGSCIVFLMIFGMVRVRPLVRLSLITLVGLMGLLQLDWVIFTFMSGLLIAELQSMSELRQNEALPGLDLTWGKSRPWTRIGNWCLFVLGFYLLCIPERPAKTPWNLGFFPLYGLSPSDEIQYPKVSQTWRSVGGSLFVFAVNNSTTLQAPFNTAIVQYLGKISFGLYLVHVMIYRMWRDKLIRYIWWITGEDSALGWIGAGIVLTPTVFLAAHLFYEYVDKRSITLAKWLSSKAQERSSL